MMQLLSVLAAQVFVLPLVSPKPGLIQLAYQSSSPQEAIP